MSQIATHLRDCWKPYRLKLWMTDYQLPPEAIEAAARAIYDESHAVWWRNTTDTRRKRYRRRADLAIRAFLDTMGVTVEEFVEKTRLPGRPEITEHRLVSRWFPVEER